MAAVLRFGEGESRSSRGCYYYCSCGWCRVTDPRGREEATTASMVAYDGESATFTGLVLVLMMTTSAASRQPLTWTAPAAEGGGTVGLVVDP